MLAENPASSGTLWGINKPRSEAYSVEAHGELAVVSYKGDQEHAAVVNSQVARGCVEKSHNEDSSLSITILMCP